MTSLFGALSVLLMTQTLSAEPVRNVRAGNTQPLAFRGGVLMLPLIADHPGDQWPTTIELQTADKSMIVGQVAWIGPEAPRAERRWTDDPRGLLIRAIEPMDDTSRIDPTAGTGPYLLARLPIDARGDLKLNGQKLKVAWCDRPDLRLSLNPALAGVVSDSTLTKVAAHDRPDPDSPFEHWRWALLAARLGFEAPEPVGSEIERMAAEHYADLWRLGLSRLASQSDRVAAECLEMLTQISADRQQSIAAWMALPGPPSALLARLTDTTRSDSDVVSDAVNWLNEQPWLYIWSVADSGGVIQLAALAARAQPVQVTFHWEGSRDEPVRMQIEPGVLTKVQIDRMPLPKSRIGLPAVPEPSVQTLLIDVHRTTQRLSFGPRQVVARPPGVYFRPLAAPVTLAEVQAQVQRIVNDERQTLVQMRRLTGRWEVFVECRRPAASDESTPSADADAAPRIDALDDLRGTEAVSFLLGNDDSRDKRSIWLVVPEHGWHQIIRGESDGTLQVHRRSLDDRWYARIVVPENWLPVAGEGPVHVGCVRSHGDTRQVEIGPGINLPWRTDPSRTAIDLSSWDDLPREP